MSVLTVSSFQVRTTSARAEVAAVITASATRTARILVTIQILLFLLRAPTPPPRPRVNEFRAVVHRRAVEDRVLRCSLRRGDGRGEEDRYGRRRQADGQACRAPGRRRSHREFAHVRTLLVREPTLNNGNPQTLRPAAPVGRSRASRAREWTPSLA